MNPIPNKQPEWQRAVIAMSATVVFGLVVLAIYWARTIFIPVALAVFLTFVLSPVVRRLEAWLGRIPAVLVTVGLAIGLFGSVGFLVYSQLAELTEQLPEKEGQIVEKLTYIRQSILGDGKSHLGETIERIQQAAFPDDPAQTPQRPEPFGALVGSVGLPDLTAAPPPPAPAPAAPAGTSWLSRLESVLSPVLEIVGQVAFGFLLSVFMLVKREDLRNRLIRLIGPTQITTTTKAVDDASRRVSRFLLAQFLINSGFGLTVMVGNLLIGVPYAVVWGVFSTAMRYVPYVGTWIGLIPPVLVSFITSDWVYQPLLVFAMYITLELTCNNVFEPWLYGASMGLSEVAQIVAAAFWTFLWGPIGLVLSGPLTVCLLVLGKYVPQFGFLQVLLGDEPALTPDVRFYQRLTARDDDEAARILNAELSEVDNPVALADAVIVPAVIHAKRDVEEGVIEKADGRAILGAIRELNEELADAVAASHEIEPGDPAEDAVRILALPARDDADRVALEVLRSILEPHRWEVEVASTESLTSELVAKVGTYRPRVICVGSLPPGGLAHTRYLCKRLRKQFPGVRVLVGRWGLTGDVNENRSQLADAGADHVAVSLRETIHHLRGWRAVLDAEQRADGSTKFGAPPRVGTPAAAYSSV